VAISAVLVQPALTVAHECCNAVDWPLVVYRTRLRRAETLLIGHWLCTGPAYVVLKHWPLVVYRTRLRRADGRTVFN